MPQLTDERIDEIANSMDGGLDGFLKTWGWRQFARAIQKEVAFDPQFDVMSPRQEELVLQFCLEIAGRRGGKGAPPDPVRLLEMADALYQAEKKDFFSERA